MNQAQTTKVKKETKNSIRVEFERTDSWTRFKLKFLSYKFLKTVVVKIFRFVLLLGISFVILFPFFSKITGSFMSTKDFLDVTVKLIPKYPTLDNYRAIIVDLHYFKALFNTFVLSMLCGIAQTFACCLIGYGFAKFKFKGRNLLFALVILTMIVPHSTLRYSMYLTFRYFDVLKIFTLLSKIGVMEAGHINMIGTYIPLSILSITGLGFKNGLYIFMMRQFFRGVPDELEESAYIDGYGPVKTFLKIIIPLSVPMMITVFLFAFSWQWTDNFYTQLFFPSATLGEKMILMPDVIGIPKSLDINHAAKELHQAAVQNTGALMVLIPLVVVYLFCQRYLIQGIERSGIVG